MKSNTALSGPMAVLFLPKSAKELLTVGKAVHDAMANNPSFPSPNPPLNVFKAKLTALDEAETKAAARTWGAAMARDAIKRHPRFRIHFTPVHCSWMNQVEQWFSILRRKRLAAPNFTDLAELQSEILHFIKEWNESAHPFTWTPKSFEKILAKVNDALRLAA